MSIIENAHYDNGRLHSVVPTPAPAPAAMARVRWHTKNISTIMMRWSSVISPAGRVRRVSIATMSVRVVA
jgi:hypothetical protein